MELTCVIIKPDGLGKKKAGDVLRRLEAENLKLVGIKMIWLDARKAEAFYDIHRGKPFYAPLVHFMTASPVIVTAWQGEDAIKAVRGIIGATNSPEAAPGTLRKMFGTDNRRNLVHASDSPENGRRETSFFFAKEELFEYDADEWRNR